MFDNVFEYLFKYPQVAYERGEVIWSGSWHPLLLLGVFVGGAGLVYASYRWGRARTSVAATWTLVLLRAAGLAVLLVCLLRPTLVLSTAVPQQNVAAVIIDDSRSMEIPDEGSRPRAEVARELFASEESALLGSVSERFMVRHFRFSALAERLRDSGELDASGTRSLIGPALDFVRQELATLPLSGIVLVTDGGDQDPEALEDALLGLRAEGIPVHAVGVGRESLEPEVEIERVEIPRTVIQGSTVIADVVVAHTGLAGVTVPVNLEESGSILATEEVELTGRTGSATVRIPFSLDDPGVRNLRIRVPVQEGEVVEENNARDIHVEVRDGREKILYYEGQPRFEVGFLRQAVREDQNLQVVVLQRTGEERFVRLDVDSGDELSGGFPSTREELFEYRALILGSVEASSFTPDQLRMIVDFVDRRGGSLLVLGGPAALAEGGFAGTALAPLLPVEIASPFGEVEGTEDFWATLRLLPTRSGMTHPALRLAEEAEEDAGEEGAGEEGEAEGGVTPWEELPALTTVNLVGESRPGATVLLEGEVQEVFGSRAGPDFAERASPVFAFQRYGAGLSAVLAVHDTWLWQMHADIPLEDETHERFWQQVLRWMVQEVPEPLEALAAETRVAPAQPVELVARVSSEEFLPVNDAQVTARIIDPFGAEEELALTWDLDRDGEYRGSFLPAVDGPYEVEVSALDGDRALAAPPLHIQAGVLDEELQSGAMRGNLLRRIASETNGQFYTVGELDGLPEALRYTERGTVVQEERDLWDLPLFFFLLMALLFAEWVVRRRLGLA